MSKYNRPPFFTSHYSNISPPATSLDMARSSSRDSATYACAYASLTSQPLSRSSSTTSHTSSTHMMPPTSAPSSTAMRRSSSSSSSQTTWLASPYRSCLNTTASEPSSYLSDDDLLSLNIPVETIPTPKRATEMTTEEQIAHLREMQEREEREERARREALSPRRKQVRFQPTAQDKSRRPSQVKRRSTTVRKGLSGLNGPM
jgi:hypothetical protein